MYQLGEDLRVRLDRFKAPDVFYCEVDVALMLPPQGCSQGPTTGPRQRAVSMKIVIVSADLVEDIWWK